MKITFYKYQGTGNDFILIDNRQLYFSKNDTILIRHLCNRKFGIGADGLILLEEDENTDFRMVYYNADGNEGSMCGNGARCIVAFARLLGIIDTSAVFTATDGTHLAFISGDTVKLQMQDVDKIEKFSGHVFLDTGSPHHVQPVKNLDTMDVGALGKKLRYGKYGKTGSNINFVERQANDLFSVRTYERGVEAETLSCGTGVTAVALAMYETGETKATAVTVQTLGGELKVAFGRGTTGYKDIYLEGPAVQVFKGTIVC